MRALLESQERLRKNIQVFKEYDYKSACGATSLSLDLCFSPSQPGCEKYVAKLAAEEDELASLYTSLDDRKKTRTATNKTLAASCAAIRFSKKLA